MAGAPGPRPRLAAVLLPPGAALAPFTSAALGIVGGAALGHLA
jgi:hypothetical protein